MGAGFPPPPAPRIAAPRATTPTPLPESNDALARAAEIVHAGQRALAEGKAELALAQARAHRREFPSGALAEDAGLLEIAALCRLARTDEAARSAAALRERFPDSSLVGARAEAPCGG